MPVCECLSDFVQVFSPLFNRDFMLEVLRFQKLVEAVTSKDEKVAFQDVCHQPLAPEKGEEAGLPEGRDLGRRRGSVVR